MPNLVFGGVSIGDQMDCPKWPGARINTMAPHQLCVVPFCYPMEALELDVSREMRFPLANLKRIAAKIEERAQDKIPVLVHCVQGIDRSPLSVAYWLHRHRGFSFDDAYALVLKARPQAIDRRNWIV